MIRRSASRSQQAKLRALTYNRDHGVCSECGYPANFMENAMMAAFGMLFELAPYADPALCGAWRTLKLAELKIELGLPLKKPSYWEADHIDPLRRTGTNDMSNLQTLCCVQGPDGEPSCHQRKSNREAKEEAKKVRLWKKMPRMV